MAIVQQVQNVWQRIMGTTNQQVISKEKYDPEKIEPQPITSAEFGTSEDSIAANMPTVQYTPDALLTKKKFGVYDDMIWNDSEIDNSINTLKTIRLSSGYKINYKDEETNPQRKEIVDYVRWNLDNIQGGFNDDLREIMGALEMGWSLQEKVWETVTEGKYAGKVRLIALKSKRPKYFSLAVDEYDNLVADGVVSISGDKFGKQFPTEKFVVYSLNKRYENVFGTSRLRSLYSLYFIKKVLERCYGIYMEKYGRPIVAFQPKQKIDSTTKTALLTILKQLRYETTMVIPEAIELTIKEMAEGHGDSYIKGMEFINSQIRKTIQGQTLTSEPGTSGSFALGGVHLDILEMFINALGIDIANQAVNSQIIKQLVIYNYGKQDEYPTLEFNSIIKKDYAVIIDKYYAGVDKRILTPQREDEIQIRDWLGMPKLQERIQPISEQISDIKVIPKLSPATIPTVTLAEKQCSGVRRRTLTVYEQRTDFAEIEQVQNLTVNRFTPKLIETIRASVDDIIGQIEKYDLTNPNNIKDIERIKVKYVGDLKSIYLELLETGLTDGVKSARTDIKTRKADKLAEVVDIRPVTPKQTLELLKVKAYTIAGSDQSYLTKVVKNTLINTVKTGATLKDTIETIQREMEGYYTRGIPIEDVEALTGARLETTVRTIQNDAYNLGRKEYFEDPALKGYVEAYQYSAIMDDRVRPNHACMDGRIYAVTSDVWNTFTPPNGYNCRCLLVPVTIDDEWQESDYPSANCRPDVGFEKPGSPR